jgi:hypothetical protein
MTVQVAGMTMGAGMTAGAETTEERAEVTELRVFAAALD